MSQQPKPIRVVTIGGGTGQFTLLSALKTLPNIEATAIVSMADSGGSSGRLRDELGALPPGDVLKALLALSELPEEVVRDLLLHRFSEGTLRDHNAGNMLLTMLAQYTENFLTGVRGFSEILRVRGTVLPVTLGSITLRAELENGAVIVGETNIDVPKHDAALRIRRVWLEPNASALPEAIAAIREADCLFIGPGDLYTSILPVLLVHGIREAISETRAKKAYICNIMTKAGETHGFRASDFVRVIEECLRLTLDIVICNTGTPLAKTLSRYEHESAALVEPDLPGSRGARNILGADLMSAGELARHDHKKLGALLKRALQP
ncbi:MAG: gluconeogenesis factor YvcK family protein [Patescibacteria group bacterium]